MKPTILDSGSNIESKRERVPDRSRASLQDFLTFPPQHRAPSPVAKPEAKPEAKPAPANAGMSAAASAIIGAKTIAGVGLGIMAVIGGIAALGAVSEIVLVPTLLLKLAGGIAGGGIGMASGLKDAKKSD